MRSKTVNAVIAWFGADVMLQIALTLTAVLILVVLGYPKLSSGSFVQQKKSEKQLANEKSERIMNGVAYWGQFYRNNPQRFCRDFMNVHLKLFQKILLLM